jgi:hypothetical protein
LIFPWSCFQLPWTRFQSMISSIIDLVEVRVD